MRAVAAMMLALVLAACGGGAQSLLETAQLEEVQNNPEHATQLYREIVTKYPGTPEAVQAADRLRALEAKP